MPKCMFQQLLRCGLYVTRLIGGGNATESLIHHGPSPTRPNPRVNSHAHLTVARYGRFSELGGVVKLVVAGGGEWR